MTAERDGKSRRTGQPDLLASLPDERPPASQPAPGIDPASIEELLTGVRDLREQFACQTAFNMAQLVNRMRHLVMAAARQARSLAPGARPTRWNQLR